MDASRNSLMQTNDFELHDFIDDPNFGQFIDVIRRENEKLIGRVDYDLIHGFSVENQFGPALRDVFDFNDTSCSTTMALDPNFVVNSLSSTLNEDMKEREEEDNDQEDSSDTKIRTRTTTKSSRKTKTDRSRTLNSERRRRDRMKEKLYALRALVPNITKMDKASIVGDAVLYVQELQMKATKLKAEIAGLEVSLAGSERYQQSIENKKRNNQVSPISGEPICKKLMQMDVFQVEERGFYLRLVCNKEAGVVASLYKALESLTSFNVQNSNLVTVPDKIVLTFTLNVRDCKQSMNLPNVKLRVTGALLNVGFEVQVVTPFTA